MNTQPTLLEVQAEALREFLRREQQHQSQELLDRGRQRAKQIVRDARRTARTRMHEAVEHERARMTEAIAKARAAQETAQRDRRLMLLRSKLDEAWRALPQALERRWRQPEQRRQWCISAIQLARKYFHDDAWQIHAAPGLSADERQRIAVLLPRDVGAETMITEAAELRAGLVIVTAGVSLDASIAGLLRDRPRIEALLVAELEAAERREA
jgi:hypothetical protein